MSNHAKLLSEVGKLVELKNKKNWSGIEQIIGDNEQKNIENQQLILAECVHTADLSNAGKMLGIFSKWTDYVYEEFFNQGDVEESMGKKISMLCDRKTTNINKSQIGFINFIVRPHFEMMLKLLPHIQEYLENLKRNLKHYENELEMENKENK